jgi:ABC-2 type transport system ATP-binding protein
MEFAIKVENLTKRFNDFTAVDSISFSVEKGEIFGFLGPNGAGKTTTVRILTGMIAPNSGSAEVDGLPVDRNVENLHEVIGLLTESPGFYENFSAIRNLEYFAGFYSEIDVSKQVEKHLKSVGLWEHKGDKVRTFSKGMKQRLAIARALLHEPHVVFLDEPTAGLDPESAQDVRLMIKNLKEEGRTVFLCTHNLSEAESLCDRIGVIKTQLLTLDTPEKLQEKVFKREVIVEMDSIDPAITENLRKLSFIKLIRQDGNKLIIQLEDIESNRPLLVKNIVESGGMIQNVFEKKHSLEEVYLLLMHEGDKSQEKNGNQPTF